jgi:hypothetical protein
MASKSTMIVVKQGSLHQDKTSKNGVTKNMHMVVKNTPFTITVGSSDGKFDFSAAKMEASLLYDSEDRKPVPFLQKLPLEYFTHINATGDQVTIEFRIKVLTSQYEGSLFLLKISATNDKHTITTVSESIKVVSKPEQIRRLKQTTTTQVKSETLAPAKKRRRVSDEESVDTSSSDVMEMLQAIRETQLRQMELLQQNLSMREEQQICYSSEEFSPLNLPDDSPMEVLDKPVPALSLEQAFQQLIAAYNATDVSERPTKIRRLIETDGDITSSLVAVATDLSTALPTTPLVKSDHAAESGQCQCAGCPFKKNIEQIDTFYSEFFSNPFENVEFAQ